MWLTMSLLAVTAAVLSAQSVHEVLQTITGTRQFRDSKLSPDGRWLAWTVSLLNPDQTASQNSEIWLLDLSRPGAAARRLQETKPHAEHSIAFSPDSKQLAFLSDIEKPGQFQLFLSGTDGRAPKRLTSLTGFLRAPQWSPDGKQIAILFTENAPGDLSPIEPAIKELGPVDKHIFEQRLSLVDAHSGQMHQITPPRHLRL